MLNKEDRLKLFKARVECSLHRIKLRGKRPATSSYHIVRRSGQWVLDNVFNKINPLSLLIEGKPSNIHITKTSSLVKSLTKTIGITEDELYAFNYGLKGSPRYYDGKDELEFYRFGQQTRDKIVMEKR
jgi:hypothetical protein